MALPDLVLGVDIGGTNTAIGYVDRTGKCHGEATLDTLPMQPPASFFKRLAATAEALWQELDPGHRLRGVGLGAPNGNFDRCSIENPPNLKWGHVDVREETRPYWNVPVAITNDANAAAMGERLFGAGQGMKDFIVITLGTGLGSGLVVNGTVVNGHSGFAGELGHTNAVPGGRLCGCGLKGCLETYASATGLVRTVREFLEEGHASSPLSDLPSDQLTSRRIYEAAIQGDALAIRAFEFTGEILGRKLADSVAHTSPEAIFLFGGLVSAGELLFAPTRRAMEENLFHAFKGTVQLLPSGVPQGQAAVLGAAAMIWDQLDR